MKPRGGVIASCHTLSQCLIRNSFELHKALPIFTMHQGNLGLAVWAAT